MPLARTPKPRARFTYSDLGMVALGRPQNSLIMSRGRATSPTPANTMNSTQPAACSTVDGVCLPRGGCIRPAAWLRAVLEMRPAVSDLVVVGCGGLRRSGVPAYALKATT